MLYVNPISEHSAFMQSSQTNWEDARQEEALQEFERLFLYQLLQEMRKTVTKTELFGKSSMEDFYEEMLDDALAGEMAKSGSSAWPANSNKNWPSQPLLPPSP